MKNLVIVKPEMTQETKILSLNGAMLAVKCCWQLSYMNWHFSFEGPLRDGNQITTPKKSPYRYSTNINKETRQ